MRSKNSPAAASGGAGREEDVMEEFDVRLSDEQYAEWDGTPEDLAAILDRPELAHAILGDESAIAPTKGGRLISCSIEGR